MTDLISNDIDIARRLRARDRDGWEALYATYGPRLRAFALRLTRCAHEADDLVQETFVRALPRLDRLDPETVEIGPYLFTTLRNTFYKSCKRAQRVAPVEEVPEPDAPAAIEDDPERSALLRRQREDVRRANRRLAPRQRLALALREVEDLSYAEIGEIVGLNENAVAQLISRARESLRAELRLAQVDADRLPEACRRYLPFLSQLMDGRLRGAPLQQTLDHFEGCAYCQDAMASMREASRRYRALVPVPLVAEEALAAAIEARLASSGYWRPRPRLARRVVLAGAVVAAVVALGADTLETGAAPAPPVENAAVVAPAVRSAVAAARETRPAPARRRLARRGRPAAAAPAATPSPAPRPRRPVRPARRVSGTAKVPAADRATPPAVAREPEPEPAPPAATATPVPTPDSTPEATPTPAPAPKQPDLVITELHGTGFTVANLGSAAAGVFVVRTPAGTYTFRGLGAGESQSRSWKKCLPRRVDAMADADDRVAESDESNNSSSANGLC